MDMILNKFHKKLWRLFGSMQFAVVIIIIFAVALAIGTFYESYYGAEYAGRKIYKTIPFMTIQFFMFVSVLVATIQRLPWKKHLAGFYILHLGLLLIFLGSLISYLKGIDGSITLNPKSPTQTFETNRDQLTIRPNMHKDQKFFTVKLPYVSDSTHINLKLPYPNLELVVEKFLPFADITTQWQNHHYQERILSGHFILQAPMDTNEEFYLSGHKNNQYPHKVQMGPLGLQILAQSAWSCFQSIPSQSQGAQYIVFHMEQKLCYISSAEQGREFNLANGTPVVSVENQENTKLIFRPEMTPFAVDNQGRFQPLNPWRILKLELYEDNPYLFIFTDGVAYYYQGQWNSQLWQSEKNDRVVELPWMELKLVAKKLSATEHPIKVYTPTRPIQDGGNIIAGDTKAALVRIQGKTIWVDSQYPYEHRYDGGVALFELTPRRFQLPYEITLDRFQMNFDPGTQNPATFESFVSVFHGANELSQHHIYMNNPLKIDDFTFYQASYFPLGDSYGSVLTVNYDPGRPWKYLGSLLLVLGSLWHFVFRNHFLRKPQNFRERTAASPGVQIS